MATELDSPTLGRGADWGAFLVESPLEGNTPFSPSAFGQLLFAAPDADSARDLLGVTPTSGLTFADISGTISVDQLPPGSLGTVDAIGEDALYFYTDSTALPSLVSASTTKTFLAIDFTDISGTLSLEQFPPGTVTTLDSIDEDGFYFFDNDTFTPLLLGKDDALSFLLPDQTGNDGKVLETNAGVLSWETASGGGSGSYTVSNTARVDPTGNDGTGTVGDAALPFLTVQAALDALVATSSPTVPGTVAWIDVGASFFNEDLTTSLELIGFIGKDSNYSRAFNSITITGPVVVTITATNTNLGDVSSDAANVLQLELNNVFVNSVINTTTNGQVAISNYGNTGSSQTGDVTTDDAPITFYGVDYIGTVDAGGGAIKLFNCLPVDPTSGAAVINSTGSAVEATFSLIGSVVAATTLLLKDSRVVGSNAAGTTTYTDLLLAGDDTAYDATSWNGNTRTPTKNAVRDKFESLSGDYQPLDGDLSTIAGLTATTDNFIVSVSSAWASRTPTQVRATLGLTIGTNVQAWDADLDAVAALTTDSFGLALLTKTSAAAVRSYIGAGTSSFSGAFSALSGIPTTLSGYGITDAQPLDSDLTTLAGLTATTDNFIVSVSSAWASRTPAQVLSTLAAVGTTFQPLDSDLTTIAGLTATTDNFIVSASSAWASRTPTQVKTTLGLVIGTNVQAWDADLDTIAGLTATTDNFIVSVSSAWASRTPSQVRTTLALVIGTNVQAWDADLDTWAGITPGTGVGTALAVNVGTDGAFVVKAGALGTPSGGTLTNCTGLPIAGLTASTSTALGVGSIELGAASDTTIARSGAGAITVEGVAVPTISSTNTLTNKAITKRTSTISSNATWSPVASTDDVYTITAQGAACTSIASPGAGTNGQVLLIRVKDDGTARAISGWATGTDGYRFSSDLSVPTTTTLSKVLYMLFVYDSTAARWDMMAKLDNF